MYSKQRRGRLRGVGGGGGAGVSGGGGTYVLKPFIAVWRIEGEADSYYCICNCTSSLPWNFKTIFVSFIAILAFILNF